MSLHADMASRLHSCRRLVSEFEASLSAFHASKHKFQVLKTIRPAASTPGSQVPSIDDAHPPAGGSAESPRTLYILDSSYNPPSKAHQQLVMSALSKASVSRHPGPHRLVLLFAVLNADKASTSPAAPAQRLTMMSLFAQDLVERLSNPTAASKAGHDRDGSEGVAVPVDIAITKEPYYTDKSEAIATSEHEGSETSFYLDSPIHVHLLGFDTLTRFFNPKYYSSFDPPLSALKGYFDAGHVLRATLRPDDASGDEAEQRAWLKRLEDGELESDGASRAWAKQVELVAPHSEFGVSSTRIRKAAADSEWDEVTRLCSNGVAAWVQAESLYR